MYDEVINKDAKVIHNYKKKRKILNDITLSYKDYLMLIQEKNRTRRKLREKTTDEKAVEKLENEFCIYLNGANAKTEKFSTSCSCISKTDESKDSNAQMLSKRKNWLAKSIIVKSEKGPNVRIGVPRSNADLISDENEKDQNDNFNATNGDDVINTLDFKEYNTIIEKAEMSSDKFSKNWILNSSQAENTYHPSVRSDFVNRRICRQRKDISRPVESTSAIFRPSIFQKGIHKDESEDELVLENTVCIEILSNWGHPHRVGLTEIQFFDDKGQKIEVLADEMDAIGADDCKGKLQNLINGKTKTVKERYMWSCVLPLEPVKLVLRVDACDSVRIASIKIWNYNHSIKDLLIGVRQSRIFLGQTLVFDGILDKGCGNQVFDYSQVIKIICGIDDHALPQQTFNPGFACEPMLIGRHANRFLSLNSLTMTDTSMTELKCDETRLPSGFSNSAKSFGNASAPFDTAGRMTQNSSNSGVIHELVGSGSDETVSGQQQDPTNLMPDKHCRKGKGDALEPPTSKISSWSLDVAQPQGNIRPSSMITSTRFGWYSNPETPAKEQSSHETFEYNQTNRQEVPFSPTKPKWLETIQKQEMFHFKTASGERPSWLKGLDIDLTEPFQNPPESQPESRCGSGISRTSSGRPRKGDTDSLFELLDKTDRTTKSRDLASLLESESCSSRETSAKYGRRAVPSPIPSSGDPRRRQVPPFSSIEIPSAREESARTRTRRNMDNRLEESWTSLHMFNRHHRGRLSINMEGDVLDSYLNMEKPKMLEQSVPSEVNCVKNPISDFIIPELPEGQELVIDILTTWGDHHYVGLNGIEIFSSTGDPVKIEKITAQPEDINVLPEYSKDPRVVRNLIDGVYKTWDDMHLWLTPFTPGNDHFVLMTFEKYVKVAMIRIWNYNKSRIHSFRGARFIIITLDGQCIFKGEIARACGGIQGGIESFGDTILFTTDDEILENIAKNDETFTSYISATPEYPKDEVVIERPRTGYLSNEGERPLTSAESSYRGNPIDAWDSPRSTPSDDVDDSLVFTGQHIQLNILSNWGDCSCVGLTGVEILNELGHPLSFKSLSYSSATHDPVSVNTLNRLTDMINVSTLENHMWITSFVEGNDHKLNIKLEKPEPLIGIRIWNYNKSSEDSYKGVKLLQVCIDEKLVSPSEGFLIRKGPGNCHFDFAQEVLFSGPPSYCLLTSSTPKTSDSYKISNVDDALTQDYESPVMPRGFVFQLQLYSTWGDPYYVGMNGIEMYDAEGTKIPLAQNNIAAYPDSVNVLDNISNDVRTPDKLVDNINDTMDGHHMWLAPVLPSILNRIYIVFDHPVTVSMLKLWNYSKTSTRGVKEFGLLVDDLLVYHNILNPVGKIAESKDLSSPIVKSVPYHTVLFTSDKEIAMREKHSILRNRDVDQDVQLTNDSHVLHKGTSAKAVDQALRPMTSMTSSMPFK